MFLYLLQNMFDTIRDLPTAIQQSTVPEFGQYLAQFHNGIMKIMVILHHDFPDFLAENHFRLCNAVSDDQVQIKNLIISAVPTSIHRMEEPHVSKQPADYEGMQEVPVVHKDFLIMLTEAKLMPLIDAMFESDVRQADYARLVKAIQEAQLPEGKFKHQLSRDRHIRSLVHAVVLYIGVKTTVPTSPESATTAGMKAVQQLGLEMTASGVEQNLLRGLSEAIVNQLRYPNTHTLFFLTLFVNMFLSAPTPDDGSFDENSLLEFLSRSLVERLVVHRPHAWGVIAAFLEMHKIGTAAFWDRPFVKDVPEVSFLSLIHQVLT
jgi:CCR4-NOT transcription complex subunit 1